MLPYGTATNATCPAARPAGKSSRFVRLVASLSGERLGLFFGREHAWLKSQYPVRDDLESRGRDV